MNISSLQFVVGAGQAGYYLPLKKGLFSRLSRPTYRIIGRDDAELRPFTFSQNDAAPSRPYRNYKDDFAVDEPCQK